MVKDISDEIEFMQESQLVLNQSFKEDSEIFEQEAMQNIYQDLKKIERKNPISKLIDNIKLKSMNKKISKEFINSEFLNRKR